MDRNVARKIAAAVGAGSGDIVVEIGPGLGAITFGLAESAREVIGVEVDSGIARAFREEYGDVPRFTLVSGDFLAFDLKEAARERGAGDLIVAGNLPYSVTSPVLRRLADARSVVRRAVLMVQAEVGARIAASPGSPEYSALSAVVRYHAGVRALFSVSRTCFHPRPRVDSRVIEIDFAAGPARTGGDAAYSDVVHAAFRQRRKMLRQSLGALLQQAGVTPDELSAGTGVDLRRRGESLSPEEFDTLALVIGRAGDRAKEAE